MLADVGKRRGGEDSNENDIEKQGSPAEAVVREGSLMPLVEDSGGVQNESPPLTVVVSDTGASLPSEVDGKDTEGVVVEGDTEGVTVVASPKKGCLSRSGSSCEQCRVCQEEKEELLIDLGCNCRGGLGKAHRSCIDAWFRTKGSNKCEICQQAAGNVSVPECHQSANYWVWRLDPAFGGAAVVQERQSSCVSPLWVAFSILIGGLLLDVLISITLGVSALPVNIIIGVVIVLGLGTAIRLALDFCHEWRVRRVVQGVETNVNLAYHPTL